MARGKRKFALHDSPTGVHAAPNVGAPVVPSVEPEVTAARREFLEGLVLVGAPRSRILQLARRKGYSTKICDEDIRLIRAEHAADQADREKTRRSDQLARLRNSLMRMQSEARPPWAAIQATEKLIAEIEGNLAPRRLEVGLTAIPDALAAAVSAMTPESIEAAIAEELERNRLLASAIPTTGESVPDAASPPP